MAPVPYQMRAHAALADRGGNAAKILPRLWFVIRDDQNHTAQEFPHHARPLSDIYPSVSSATMRFYDAEMKTSLKSGIFPF